MRKGSVTTRAAEHPRPAPRPYARRAGGSKKSRKLKRHEQMNVTDEDLQALDDPALLDEYRAAREHSDNHPSDRDAVTRMLTLRNEITRRTRSKRL